MKWEGKIGYSITSEIEPGLYEGKIKEYFCFGDLITDRRKRITTDINDNISLSNVLSIIMDPFIYQNCSHIIYVEIMGDKWKVSDIEVNYPRLNLTIGDVYNGPD